LEEEEGTAVGILAGAKGGGLPSVPVEEASIRDVTALMPELLALVLLRANVLSWGQVETGVVELEEPEAPLVCRLTILRLVGGVFV
jgi:hypothetical protein